MTGVFNSIDPDVPHNAGSFRRIDGAAARGLHRRHPAVSALVLDGDHQRRRSPGVPHPGRVRRAGRGVRARRGRVGMGICLRGDLRARRPADGAPYVNQVFLGSSGGPGGPPPTAGRPTTAGRASLIYHDSAEVDEQRYPIHVHVKRLIPDSEGPGRHRGRSGPRSSTAPRICRYDRLHVRGPREPARGVRGGGTGSPLGRLEVRSRRQPRRHADGGGDDDRARRAGPLPNRRWRRLRRPADARSSRSPTTCAEGCGLAAPGPQRIRRDPHRRRNRSLRAGGGQDPPPDRSERSDGHDRRVAAARGPDQDRPRPLRAGPDRPGLSGRQPDLRLRARPRPPRRGGRPGRASTPRPKRCSTTSAAIEAGGSVAGEDHQGQHLPDPTWRTPKIIECAAGTSPRPTPADTIVEVWRTRAARADDRDRGRGARGGHSRADRR